MFFSGAIGVIFGLIWKRIMKDETFPFAPALVVSLMICLLFGNILAGYLNDDNIVVDIIVGKDETETINGLDTETYYALGTPYTVKRTSYNGRIRYNYAGLFYSYDPIADAFIAPKPECGHAELVLDTATYRWNCENAEHVKEF